ncbi:uncharacterized protein RCC_08645 [Ramularia collo-cygni]|uniref:Uncharacterized protein n=1 Tax=Ramularia collo-cygni TaxID=112498 RepID=A0A2D3UY05_9PEZI|nr:uncharacterized protein RCC_08645 [Ramularia collo-cygni]CZT22937.1 uncharacterized protein RCC_08645 [Ramularia collo-cygni]
MSSSRRDSVRPVVVEIEPQRRHSNKSPQSPSSPKAVRFAPSSGNAISRPLTTIEAWSLYHFENHARHCASCYNPLQVVQRGGQLCDIGHGLAQDVAYHVYHREGEFYSTSKDDAKLVRIEIPPGYTQLRSLLKSMDRALRSHRISTSSPIISYDRTYPVAPRRFDDRSERESVFVEPASSSSHSKSSHHRKSKHKSSRYSTVALNDDDDDGYAVKSPSSPIQRRGTLYEQDMQRKKENYRVEIREPTRHGREKERRSGVWL